MSANPPVPARRLVCLCLIIGAIVLQPRVASAECQLKQLASLPATVDSSGTLLVPTTLDGKPASLVLDTGAVWSVLRESVAGDHPRHTAARSIVGAGGAPTNSFVDIQTMQLGPMKLSGVDFYVEPDTLSPDATIAGNIAINLLGRTDLEIDPAAGRMALYSQDHCPAQVVYWPHTDLATMPLRQGDGGVVSVEVQLDGKPLTALIDTGASISILQAGAAGRLFDLEPGGAGMEASGSAASVDGGSVPLYRHRFETLSMGGIVFHRPWLTVAQRPRSSAASGIWNAHALPDLVLGMHQLRLLHLYFAFGEKTLYATSAGASGQPQPADWFDYASVKDAMVQASEAMRRGHPDQAIPVLDSAIKTSPNLTMLYVERASCYRLIHNDDAALSDFDHALAIAPGDPSTLVGRGFVRIELGRPADAIADFDAALARHPSDAGAFYGRSLARQRTGDSAGAASDLAAATRIDPEAAQHYPLF